MTKLLLTAVACFAFVATTSSVFADNNPGSEQPQGGNPALNGEQQQNPQNPQQNPNQELNQNPQ
ncbi:MAG: hypothetical protein NWS47_00195 [Alphaproteobacteria bacterium]|nr:hypothetical protein [Alphaproteobacteria bacterium]